MENHIISLLIIIVQVVDPYLKGLKPRVQIELQPQWLKEVNPILTIEGKVKQS